MNKRRGDRTQNELILRTMRVPLGEEERVSEGGVINSSAIRESIEETSEEFHDDYEDADFGQIIKRIFSQQMISN